LNFGNLDFDIVSDFELRISSLWATSIENPAIYMPIIYVPIRHSTSVESSLQISSFLYQTNPIFPIFLLKMKIMSKNKANSNPIKANNQSSFINSQL
jgi:hypothetical protein